MPITAIQRGRENWYREYSNSFINLSFITASPRAKIVPEVPVYVKKDEPPRGCGMRQLCKNPERVVFEAIRFRAQDCGTSFPHGLIFK